MSAPAKRLAPGVLALALCLQQAGPARANEELYRKVAASTAVIYKNEGPFGGGAGTGFLIDARERLLVTARHVVEKTGGGGAHAVIVIFAETRDGQVITDVSHYRRHWATLALRGKVVYESVRRDMAVIQVEKLPAGIKALELAAHAARPGQMVHLVGNSSERFGGVFSYCRGYVRNVFRWEDLGARVVATQAPTNRGDSGGPTVNNLGEVVGFACMSTTGASPPKESIFHELQVTGLSVCVTEIREGLREMRERQLAERPGPARPDSQAAVTFQGQARPGSHLVPLEKDVTYRIRVKAKGFIPDVRIDNFLINPARPSGRLPGEEWQHLFTPRETREHRIQVGSWLGRDLGKGPFPYTLTVDQVAFVAETAFKDQRLTRNEHVRHLEAGKVYRITVKGQGFEPDVQVLDGNKSVGGRFNDGRRASASAGQHFLEDVGLATTDFETSLTFVPDRTADYRIMVAVSPFSPPARVPPYTVRVAEQKVQLSVKDQLTVKDKLYPQAGPFKVHPVKLEAGKNYQIDLVTTAFDGHLVLEDAAGKVLVQGFDAEGYNGRLLFRPARTDTYRVVATSHQIDAAGPYLVTVAESPDAPPAPPRPAAPQKGAR
jgi:hypothetical protein